MNDTSLMEVNGGAISGTLLSAVVKLADTMYKLGKSLGSSIRILLTGSRC